MMDWIEKNILPVAVKIGNQRHLIAVRDAFIGMIALTMAGSFAVLLRFIGGTDGMEWYPKMMNNIFGDNWDPFFMHIQVGSLVVMTIFIVFGIAYKLARSYGDDGFEAMFVAFASFMTLVPFGVTIGKETAGGFADKYFGSLALFTGIIISLVATEIFVRLTKVSWLTIKLPEAVPPAVSRAFAKLFPGMITIALFALVSQLFTAIGDTNVIDWVGEVLVKPLSNAADSLPSAILIVFLVHFFWIFGLHGNNILAGIISPLMTKLGLDNIDLYSQGLAANSDKYHTLAGSFLDVFVYFGGSGATMGLLFALLLASKTRKQMVALGMPPGIFNINEPITFGMPIVLNPIWVIPFILTPIVLVTVAYIAVSTHIVHPVIASVPWTTPPIIGGFLATSHWSGAALAVVNLAISFVIYLPFVIISNKADEKAMAAAQKK
jgi:PTS system cellobiose-specific IIC component